MQLQIVTPQGSKVETEISEITAPGVVGDLGVLPGHRPLLTALGIGVLTFKAGGSDANLAVNGGYLEVADDHVVVITETAETPDEIDVERAQKALADAEKALQDTDPDRSEAVAIAIADMRRAENRIAVSKLQGPVIPQ